MNILDDNEFNQAVEKLRNTYVSLVMNTQDVEQRNLWHLKATVLNEVISSLNAVIKKPEENVINIVRPSRLQRLRNGLI